MRSSISSQDPQIPHVDERRDEEEHAVAYQHAVDRFECAGADRDGVERVAVETLGGVASAGITLLFRTVEVVARHPRDTRAAGLDERRELIRERRLSGRAPPVDRDTLSL